MALVLKERKTRAGETKSFTVVRAQDGTQVDELLADIREGQYKILANDLVTTWDVDYETVTYQHNTPVA